MAVNPSYEDAYKIVKLYWEEGLSKKDAVIQSGAYSEASAKKHWKYIWEKEDGEYRCGNIQKAFEEFKERIVPRVQRKLPELVDEYLKLCRQNPDPAEKRRSIQFLLETVGDFVKGKELTINESGKFDNMGPEEMIEFFEKMPGVEVDSKELISGMLD
ncbi:MAG: hypothetical protein K9L56_14215 [Clostridiales bacterium]|nr:hypothetical protein [Clostridiales bacterium]